jgi:hypothetical protein
MGRKPLTPDEIAEREAQKAAQQSTKRVINKKNSVTSNPTVMETNNPQNTDTSSEPVNTQPVVTEAATEVVQPTVQANTTVAHPTDTTVAKPVNTGTKKPFKPFVGAPVARSYSTPPIDQSLLNTEIPEANFGGPSGPPVVNAQELLNKPAQPAANLAEQTREKTGYNALPPDQQKQTSATAVDIALSVYEKIHAGARKLIKAKEEPLLEMHRKNEIDLGAIVIPEGPEQQAVNLYGFVQQVNKDIDQVITVSPDFKEDVRPYLERVFAKYGIGASDEAYLLVKFGDDIATKSFMGYGLMKTVKETVNSFKEHHMGTQAAIQAEAQRIADEREAVKKAAEEKTHKKTPVVEPTNLEESTEAK